MPSPKTNSKKRLRTDESEPEDGDEKDKPNPNEKKIIEDNTEALVKDFINKLKKPDAFCKKLNE